MCITFSKILENEGKSDTGLYLAMKFLFPSLKMVLTVENLVMMGIFLRLRADYIHIYIYIYIYIYIKGELIVFAHVFNVLLGISSYPKALEHCKDFIIF